MIVFCRPTKLDATIPDRPAAAIIQFASNSQRHALKILARSPNAVTRKAGLAPTTAVAKVLVAAIGLLALSPIRCVADDLQSGHG